MNPISVNGVMVCQNTEMELEHGDVLELVYGRHAFEVVFKPPPEAKPAPLGTVETKENPNIEASENSSWSSIENNKGLVYTSKGVRSSVRIAGYDIDGTIIKTKSGNVFPKTTDDWQLNFAGDKIKQKLKRLHESGYKICFFTNQGGIAKGKVDVNEFKQKVTKIIDLLGVPIQTFISIENGFLRKPLPGMWFEMRDNCNDNLKLELEKCFFVGDAAGRPEVGKGVQKRRKDHSLADRFFAENIGISFYTPEEHFLDVRKEQWIAPEFNPAKCFDDNIPLLTPQDSKIPADKQEIIVMVGLPGSGKIFHYEKCVFYKTKADLSF